jgi:hypothetical protein
VRLAAHLLRWHQQLLPAGLAAWLQPGGALVACWTMLAGSLTVVAQSESIGGHFHVMPCMALCSSPCMNIKATLA